MNFPRGWTDNNEIATSTRVGLITEKIPWNYVYINFLSSNASHLPFFAALADIAMMARTLPVHPGLCRSKAAKHGS